MRRLFADGWEWQEYLPPSKRRKAERSLVDVYFPGAPQCMKTSLHQVSKPYLLSLLNAEEHFEHGLKCVPHGSTDVIYNGIRDRSYAAANAILDVQPALEDEQLGPDIAVDAPPAMSKRKARSKQRARRSPMPAVVQEAETIAQDRADVESPLSYIN